MALSLAARIGLATAGALATTGVVVVAVALPNLSTASDRATVTRVIDGDTVDVTLDGITERVRLLNIDTPETVHPDREGQCLGPEASDYLAGLLPPGTPVRLEYDVERRDRYDRLLAGVYTGGTLVNAQIAKDGLGVPVLFEPNDRFYRQVSRAAESAERLNRGLHDPNLACALSAQVDAFQDAAQDALAAGADAGVGTSVDDLDGHIVATLAAIKLADALLPDLSAPDSFPALAHDRLTVTRWKADVEAERERLLDARIALGSVRDEAVAVAAREAEEARLAAEAEEAAREEAERQARIEEESRRAAERERRDSSSDTSAGSSGGSGADSGYTGCRAYAPGGKTWKPIPCP